MIYWVWVTHVDSKGRLRPYILGCRNNEQEAWQLAFGIKDSEPHVSALRTTNKREAIQSIKGEILQMTKDLDIATQRFSHKLEEA